MNTYDAFTTITLSVSTNSIPATSYSEAEQEFIEKLQLFSETTKRLQDGLSVEIVNIDECQLLHNAPPRRSNSYTSMASLLTPTPATAPASQPNTSSRYTPLTPAF
jgi:hypothetical protein